jgi:carboxyl-terminal processing protease
MFQKMVEAIHRRDLLEKRIDQVELPKGVEASEFKDLKWAKTEEDLYNRLLRIKALQVESAEKINEESKDIALQRLAKRRLKREQEFLTTNAVDKQHFILSMVLKAVAASLDTHTAYFTPSEAEQFMIQVQQRLVGLGVQIRDDLSGFTVVKIIEGGPAAEDKKLKVNDRIIAINGDPVVGMDIYEVVELLRGEDGTKVDLTVLREMDEDGEKKKEKLNLTLKRGEVILKETRFESSYEPYGEGAIAHIRLFAFYQDAQNSSATDIYEALKKIKKEHELKGVILDLRDNPGGILPQAVAVTGLFITKGVVVSVKDSTGAVQHLRDIDGQMAWDGPLIVLTNRISASAAEIVAQTLQDYGRAIIVGDDHTFGKGTFQTFTLDSLSNKVNPQGEYKVTRGKYYTVSGKTPQLVGVIPSIVVPGPYSSLDVGEKFTEYPLENDEIAPQFDDDLSDVPSFKREPLSFLYKSNLQARLTTYNPYLPTLQKNSEERIKEDKAYQKFLKEIKKPNPDSEVLKLYTETDFQYLETVNVMKDLLYMMKQH